MIDLYSDTTTKPTAGMRQAIASAEVGDEQRGEDPTVNALLAYTAELLGKEAALFLPTGTMCNLVAVKTWTQPGETIICEQRGHVLRMESGGAALASGVIVETIPSEHGQFGPEDVLTAMPPKMVYTPPATLLCVEQTHNFGGGTVWTVDELTAVADVAHTQGLMVHMDGARLMNAVVAAGVPAADFAAPCDSVWLDFTKGLGAPMGAVLAGSKDFIERARRYKHLFGGAMRQAGIAAAGCLYSLENHVARLAEDHAHARLFAAGLAAIPGINILNRVDTNIVFIDAGGTGWDAAALHQALLDRGLGISRIGHSLRAVTHMDVSRDEVQTAVKIVRDVASRF